MAETPKITITSLKNGIGIISPGDAGRGLPLSNLPKIINNRKAILQINVNREKKESTFISIIGLKILCKIIVIWRNS